MYKKAYVLGLFILVFLITFPCHGTENVEKYSSSNDECRAVGAKKEDHRRFKKQSGGAEESGESPTKEKPEETLEIKLQQLQYSQLLEVHRSYFTAFLQTLSIYLAIMGACAKFWYDSVKDKNIKNVRSIFCALAIFSFLASLLFFAGMLCGEADARAREHHIATAATQLQIQPIKATLLRHTIYIMMFGTGGFIAFWAVGPAVLWFVRKE